MMKAEPSIHPAVRRVRELYLQGLTPPMKVRDLMQPKFGSLSPCSPAQKVLSAYCSQPSHQAPEHPQTEKK